MMNQRLWTLSSLKDRCDGWGQYSCLLLSHLYTCSHEQAQYLLDSSPTEYREKIIFITQTVTCKVIKIMWSVTCLIII